MKKIILITLCVITLISCNDKAIIIADTIYFGGDILTMEGNSPEYAEAIAVKEGKIVFIGSTKETMKLKGDKTILKDLKGKTLLPGFLDAHSHYLNSLLVANQCQLYPPPSGPASDVEAIIKSLKEFVKQKNIKEGELIIGYGYDDNVMPNGRLLNRDDLDKAFPNNPVRIDHVSMHGCVLNSLAQKYYGISKETVTPPGGIIVRKPGTQEPYGLIMETAFLPIFEKGEKMTAQQEIDNSYAGQMLFAKAGITTAHEGSTPYTKLETLKRVSEANGNIIDIVAFPFITDVDKTLTSIPLTDWRKYNNGFKIGGVKITIDGSPQGKTAFFSTPYLTDGPSGEKNWSGELIFNQDIVNQMVKKVYDLNVPLNLHCNGDASIDAFLKAYELARNGDFSKPWNVTTIHTQFMRKDHMDKFIKYKIRPSFYTLHTYYFYEAHLKNRGFKEAQYISPMRDAIDAGMKPTNHTDFVVAPLDQMFMLWSSVNRISRAGANVGLNQKISAYEGLQAMTINVAAQYDEENSKGSIKLGKLADFVILDKNPVKVAPNAIKDIKIVETIKENKIIYPEQPNRKKIIAANSDKTYTWTAHVCDMATVNEAAHKTWKLKNLNGENIDEIKVPTLKFEYGKVEAYTGVNQIIASYALINKSLAISNVKSTQKNGDLKLMALENKFKKMLASVDGFDVKGKFLELKSKEKIVAVFYSDDAVKFGQKKSK